MCNVPMKLVKMRNPSGNETVGLLRGDRVAPMALSGGQYRSLADILEADDPASTVEFLVDTSVKPLPLSEVKLLAPIDQQEVWAAGVTYERSKKARMQESDAAADCYDRVYEADRPELFFKATPHRVAGPGQPIRIRQDSAWNVPEPELGLVLNSRLELVGFTIGNDVSSRDIEGENPLYLPQAKVYDECCGLGPCITLAAGMPDPKDVMIQLDVVRGKEVVFRGTTSVTSMVRSYADLIGWLGRDNSFPHGAVLLTGTGIIPSDDFTLKPRDIVEIGITGIGTLANPVVQG
jgi:2-dehydro-3-deoxy-D-arabinonate dehydratase